MAQAMALNVVDQPPQECFTRASYSQNTEAHEGEDADFAASLHVEVPNNGNGEYSEAQIYEGGPCCLCMSTIISGGLSKQRTHNPEI